VAFSGRPAVVALSPDGGWLAVLDRRHVAIINPETSVKQHLIAHKMGIVDEPHLRATGDTNAIIGRKVTVTWSPAHLFKCGCNTVARTWSDCTASAAFLGLLATFLTKADQRCFLARWQLD
jgi:hypothetical protein